jgi:pre-mRNA-processing factor 40
VLQTMLEELRDAGKIVAGSKWSEVYPIIELDERYHNILGNPGSSPLDLFWDVVDELDQKVEENCRIIENVLAPKAWSIKEDTNYEEFSKVLSDEVLDQEKGGSGGSTAEKQADGDKPKVDDAARAKVKELSEDSRRAAFGLVSLLSVFFVEEIVRLTLALRKLQARAARLAKEERRRQEKRLRNQIEDLRYALRKVEPPIDIEASYESVSRRLIF